MTGLDEVLLLRMIRHAIINRIFIESDEGYVQHSAASKLLIVEPEAMDTAGFFLEELFVRPKAPPTAHEIAKLFEARRYQDGSCNGKISKLGRAQ